MARKGMLSLVIIGALALFLAGCAGDTGSRGAEGQAGPAGASGDRGPAGLAGPEGPAGDDGRAGLEGPRGQVGGPGATGAQGETGPAGAAGMLIHSNAIISTVMHPDLGTMLVDSLGQSLYLFTRDELGKSNCSGGCAGAWPPLLTVGDPAVIAGALTNSLGTITRDDGTTQVTYNGWPLYYFVNDEAPGDVAGQDVGDVWYVVSIAGGPIQTNAVVNIAEHADLGNILVDQSGRTQYLFTVDQSNTSNCNDGCARAWPPLLTAGDPVAGEGVTAARLGTTARADGSTQVTYNGWPLYYFFLDTKPGDANGQDANNVWFGVSTYGGPVQNNAAVKTVDDAGLGTILADRSGRSLYLFTNDAANTSNCSGGCALAWPPLLTNGDPTAMDAADGALLGTITRDDGTVQVTYNDLPLYYFAIDAKPGDTVGQNVGGVWFVLTPAGEAVPAS